LRSGWEGVEQEHGGKLQSTEITGATETGNTAQVTLTSHFEGGGTYGQVALLRNNGNSWVITGFNDAENSTGPTPEFPTPEFLTPTDEPTNEGTEVVP
jgi:hypothetical protein